MDSISRIRNELLKYPDVQFVDDSSSITVPEVSPNGFPATFFDCPPQWVVSLGGWHDHFDDPTAAIDLFFLALTSKARLRVWTRGNFEYKWTFEALEDDQWQAYATDGLLFFPFWRRATMSYQQNDILPAGLTYVGSSISGGDSRNDADPSGSGLAWTINSLAASSSTTSEYQ